MLPKIKTQVFNINNLTISLNVHIVGILAQFSQNKYMAIESDGYATVTITLNANYNRRYKISVYLRIFLSHKFQPRPGSCVAN